MNYQEQKSETDTKDSFEKLLNQMGGSRNGSPEGVYDKAVGTVMKMNNFLESNASISESDLEKIRDAIRRAQYGEAIDLAEEYYQKNYVQIKKPVDEPPTLLEMVSSENK